MKPIPEVLDEIEAQAAKATLEPWEAANVVLGDGSRRTQIRVSESHVLAYLFRFSDDVPPDAAFIAAARSAVPALVAEVKLLREACERVTKADPWTERGAALGKIDALLHPDRRLGEKP
jgi:hypothetical protein